MGKIAVFGAGGRAGRRTVAEAASRGHQVTAVVRNPAQHTGLAALATTGASGGGTVAVVAGDVTDAASVAAAAAGHDAVVNAAARLDVPSVEFFPAAARALIAGLREAGVARLVLVGIGTTLEVAPGVAVHDAPDFPPANRAFSLGHTAELDVLRAADADLDWLVLAPPPVMLDDTAPGTRTYRIGDHRLLPEPDGTPPFAYADLAAALVDEAEKPEHHRMLAAVAY
ncbi:NAD(P)-dependent oxidoreductase [Yinghuangia soli]|uniref:NAD(P)H-binding protein n=1 Tax=Yinghuangia soli TaxID=2908204 RepID=A0AA41Q382_9ACTN|nr:NAD(P)H-binding protein [Yinghuangia soli]MCF2530719.1 NAD(P)H-binding protein [Yinghuangia soli]